MSATSAFPSVEEQLPVFHRGAVDLLSEAELKRKLERALAEQRPLRIKFGMDPSSADLHFGHAVQLLKLRALQELGHQIVLIVGDATAMVGDPSGKNTLRPQLGRDEVEANLQTYTAQAGLVLDMARTEIRRNSSWFDAMSFEEVLRLTGRMTVAQMLQRETFQKRLQAEEPIGIHEFLYPLMQGWDSVEVRADVELGGTDQLFNLHRGRDLQAQMGQEAQVVLTLPLINGTDGRKMSKSYGNAIGLTDSPEDIFGKTMSLTDEVMETWFVYLTAVDEAEIAEVLAGHPREAKARLGWELVRSVHGAAAADGARAAFDQRFRAKALPDDIPERTFRFEAEGIPLFALLAKLELATSSSDGRRKVEQGGVRLDGEVVKDPRFVVVAPAEPLLIQVGKRNFLRVGAE
ncbi:MAG: tyrosine--tRNA ligase [Planctomycetota bacterium]